ncbi:hypothetical protein X975_09050, partial [Stegodyphus mimosarum]
MEERTVEVKTPRSCPDEGKSPPRNPIRWCFESVKAGSALLWLLCVTSWIVTNVCRSRLSHVEDRLSILESQFQELRLNVNLPPSLNHLNTHIKSVVKQQMGYQFLSR